MLIFLISIDVKYNFNFPLCCTVLQTLKYVCVYIHIKLFIMPQTIDVLWADCSKDQILVFYLLASNPLPNSSTL